MSEELRVLDPSNEESLATLVRAEVADADAAVERAKRAAPAWAAVAPDDRARLLRRLAELVETHAEELAAIESRNAGKPIAAARGELALIVEVIHFYAGAIDKHHGATIPVSGGVDLTFNEPLGVVGLIVPWNFPLAIAAWKIAPALACGNAVVLKPAELTPLSALRFGELVREAGFPDGVLEILVGPGRSVGQRLAEHPDVAKISFTGSTEGGRSVMRAAAGTLKQLTLELGGKSANLIFADADLEGAAAAAPDAVFGNAGQDCCARSRLLVERSCFERFLELFVEAAARYRVGPVEDPGTAMGPLISADRRAQVAAYVPEDVAFRGKAPDGRGFWFPPVIVATADPAEKLVKEEIFGPVAAVLPFEDEAEAIALANDTIYGLSGSLWTADVGRAMRVSRALQSGVLSVNSNTSVRPSTPFGGVKQSGFGRELGMTAMAAYSEVKNVFVATAG